MKPHSAFSTIILMLLLLVDTSANAHAPRENYVWVNVEADHISGRFEVNINDLNNKLGLSIDADGSELASEIESTSAIVQQFLKENFGIADDAGTMEYSFTGTGLPGDVDDFAQYQFRTERKPLSDVISIENSIFLTPEYVKSDRLHRSLIIADYNKAANKEFGTESVFLVFSPGKSSGTLDLINPTGILQWKDFLEQGILHIWFGLDHVLFVLVLLLTTVLTVNNRSLSPVSSFKDAFFKTLKIVTLFTIAHSITLSLAAFGLVSLNSAFVETVIAISIIAIALKNIYPVVNSHAWLLVFAFGLFHGLGFASVMADLQFRTVQLGHILVMFNIGVEIGQFAIVALIFPVFYLLRKNAAYRFGVVVPISLAAIVLSAYWVIERTGIIDYVI